MVIPRHCLVMLCGYMKVILLSGWKSLGATCHAPDSYGGNLFLYNLPEHLMHLSFLLGGPCASAQSFKDAAAVDKYKFSIECAAPWPCASGKACLNHSDHVAERERACDNLQMHAQPGRIMTFAPKVEPMLMACVLRASSKSSKGGATHWGSCDAGWSTAGNGFCQGSTATSKYEIRKLSDVYNV